MSTTTLSISPFVFTRIDRTIRSCPLVSGNSREMLATALTILGTQVPNGFDGEDKTWTDVQIPTEAAQLVMRGVVLMGFFASQVSGKGIKDEMADILLDTAFALNADFATEQIKVMMALCDQRNSTFDIEKVLTHNVNKGNYENN